MKTNANLGGVVAIVLLAAGCGSNAQSSQVTSRPVAKDSVSSSFATERIAAAECERELRCRGLTTPYGSLEQCQAAVGDMLARTFVEDARCQASGISVSGLRDCVDETERERCELPWRAMVDAEDLRACDIAYLCTN